jgi:hypothetical protein
MRRYQNNDPRRRRKPAAKAAPASPPALGRSAAPALIGLVATLLIARLVIGIAAAATVGDRLQFGPATAPRPPLHEIIPARRLANPFAQPGAPCKLDINAMSLAGGALTVFAVRPDGVMLSWAGGATAPGADCSTPDQQILVATNDYESLLKTQMPKH